MMRFKPIPRSMPIFLPPGPTPIGTTMPVAGVPANPFAPAQVWALPGPEGIAPFSAAGSNALGCCDWCTDDRLGGELLGACPSGPTVIIEETPIPDWLLWVAGGVALLFLLKRR